MLVKLSVDCELLKVVNAGVCPHISDPENWRFVQGVLHLHIMIAGVGSSLCDVECRKRWMDGWKNHFDKDFLYSVS